MLINFSDDRHDWNHVARQAVDIADLSLVCLHQVRLGQVLHFWICGGRSQTGRILPVTRSLPLVPAMLVGLRYRPAP